MLTDVKRKRKLPRFSFLKILTSSRVKKVYADFICMYTDHLQKYVEENAKTDYYRKKLVTGQRHSTLQMLKQRDI